MSDTALAPKDFVATPSLRRACAADATALDAFVQRLSPASRRLRFHGACAGISPSRARQLCSVDGVNHQAWLAWVGQGDAAIMVGEARFVVSACGRSGELAIAVADDWQGQGVAQALMRQLLDAARAVGLSELYGEVLDNNLRMQAFLRRYGFDVDPFAPGDALRMVCDLPATASRRSAHRLFERLRSALQSTWLLPFHRNRPTRA